MKKYESSDCLIRGGLKCASQVHCGGCGFWRFIAFVFQVDAAIKEVSKKGQGWLP
jgi:hypothetical protein